MSEVEILRKKLHEEIEIYGLDYDKVIEMDRRLHEAIIKEMRVKRCLKN